MWNRRTIVTVRPSLAIHVGAGLVRTGASEIVDDAKIARSLVEFEKYHTTIQPGTTTSQSNSVAAQLTRNPMRQFITTQK